MVRVVPHVAASLCLFAHGVDRGGHSGADGASEVAGMTIRPWMIHAALMAALCCFTAWLGWSACDTRWQLRDDERKLSEAATANQAWVERFTLQAQLATRDQQLAASQEEAAQKRTEIVIKREVIYRDKIKDVAVRDCVANSGLLDLYDATLGLSDTAE